MRESKTIARWLGAAALGAIPLYLFAIRPWHLRWGATDDEVQRLMPGDNLTQSPQLDSTRALTIHASPEQIWPWLVQIGRGRAGWYSYDFIDNPGRRSADTILPEYQHLEVGDYVPTGIGRGFRVIHLEPPLFLVLELAPGATWAAGLYPVNDSETRLVSRIRVRWNLRDPREAVIAAVVDPGDFIMMRKMMLGIKRRAETLPREEAESMSFI
jgi:hypothetical protein